MVPNEEKLIRILVQQRHHFCFWLGPGGHSIIKMTGVLVGYLKRTPKGTKILFRCVGLKCLSDITSYLVSNPLSGPFKAEHPYRYQKRVFNSYDEHPYPFHTVL